MTKSQVIEKIRDEFERKFCSLYWSYYDRDTRGWEIVYSKDDIPDWYPKNALVKKHCSVHEGDDTEHHFLTSALNEMAEAAVTGTRITKSSKPATKELTTEEKFTLHWWREVGTEHGYFDELEREIAARIIDEFLLGKRCENCGREKKEDKMSTMCDDCWESE